MCKQINKANEVTKQHVQSTFAGTTQYKRAMHSNNCEFNQREQNGQNEFAKQRRNAIRKNKNNDTRSRLNLTNIQVAKKVLSRTQHRQIRFAKERDVLTTFANTKRAHAKP